jgi:FkbM family methyltransferase
LDLASSIPPRPAALLRQRVQLRVGEVELRLVPILANIDKLGLDIGANIGVYTGAMIPACKGVICFEPHPSIRQRLRSAYPKADVLPFAASDQVGRFVLRVPKFNDEEIHARSSLEDVDQDFDHDEIMVGAVRVDDLPLGTVGFIKIDVEGHELATIRGALETIRRDQPNILVESEWRHGGGPDVLAQEFLSLGYEGYFIDDATVHPIEELRRDQQWVPEIIGSASQQRMRRLRKFIARADSRNESGPINNFIFLPTLGREDSLRSIREALA